MERYVEIQNIRFSGAFALTVEVDEPLRDVPVPKLMLQPLVENAILHGFRDRSGGEIRISAYRTEEDLILTVRDNGCGVPEEVLAQYRDGAPRPGGTSACTMWTPSYASGTDPDRGVRFVPCRARARASASHFRFSGKERNRHAEGRRRGGRGAGPQGYRADGGLGRGGLRRGGRGRQRRGGAGGHPPLPPGPDRHRHPHAQAGRHRDAPPPAGGGEPGPRGLSHRVQRLFLRPVGAEAGRCGLPAQALSRRGAGRRPSPASAAAPRPQPRRLPPPRSCRRGRGRKRANTSGRR